MNPLHYVYIAVYIVVTAYCAVFVNIRFTEVSALLITFSTFLICWVVFLGINYGRLGVIRRLVRTEGRAMLLLNVATLGSWLGMFQALKLVAAPVQTVVYMSIIPLITVLLAGEWRTVSVITRGAVAVIGLLGMVVAYSHPTMLDFAVNLQLGGVLFAFFAGSFGAIFIVYSSRMQKRAGVTTNDLIVIRLPLTIIVTGLVTMPELMRVISPEFIYKVLFITAGSVIIPVWMLQQSITRIGSVRTSILMPLVPITALSLEWNEGVPVSVPAIIAIGLQCVAIMWASLVLARAREATVAVPAYTTKAERGAPAG